jgi:S-(hydroxymethyl)glutathione dehydrogenase/alcohol dehydrogenase
MGSVWNTAALQAGQSVAVFGTGGIGLFAVAAAALRGAAPVFAIDVNPLRLESAKRLGATETIRADQTDPVAAIRQQCRAGVDIAIEASGRPIVMRQALSAVRSQGGSVVIVGNARFGEQLEIDPRELNQGKRLLGTWGGDSRPDVDFPKYCELIASGKLRFDQFNSPLYRLTDAQLALNDLEGGRVNRPLITITP